MLILGHRGAKAYAPENTLPAFQKAMDLGADGVELDVHPTRDGALVVCHNFTVDDTSNGSGTIHSMTLKELKKLDFGASFGPAFQGVQIPTLSEVLHLVRTMKCINIELKSPPTPYAGLPERVCALIQELNLTERVLLSSFDHTTVCKAKEILPAVRVGLLYEHRRIAHPAQYCLERGADAIHPQSHLVRRRDVEECLERGVAVNVWTVNRAWRAKTLLQWGCSAVITNVPDIIRRVVPPEKSSPSGK